MGSAKKAAKIIKKIPLPNGGSFEPHKAGFEPPQEKMSLAHAQHHAAAHAEMVMNGQSRTVYATDILPVGVIGTHTTEGGIALQVEMTNTWNGKAIVILGLDFAMTIPRQISTFGGLKRHLERVTVQH